MPVIYMNYMGGTKKYNITYTLTNCTKATDAPTKIKKNKFVAIIITPDSGYSIVDSVITVTGATKSWNSSTNTLTISNPTDDITITINAVILNYLCFTANTAGSTISMAKEGNPYTLTLYYSYDKSTWSPFTVGTTSITLSNVGDKVYFKGDNTKISSSSVNYNYFVMSGSIAASGDVTTLFKDIGITALNSYAFFKLFVDCTSLTTAPELPVTTLAKYCYFSMFYGCTNLTIAPMLPATTLTDYCYCEMFYGCTSLTTAPTLPATNLAEFCYSGMFYGCTGLTIASELPATTLADYCYANMFYRCSELTTAPALPAVALASSCYSNMFYECTSLITAPSILPAIILSDYCYNHMFYRCNALITPPELPATILASNCYNNMFSQCIKLTSLPRLSANILADNCYYCMFWSCIGIKISETQTSEYSTEYSFGVVLNSTYAESMFTGTGGTFTGTPTQKTYYTVNEIIPAIDYLCFTANTTGCSLGMSRSGSGAPSVTLYYSTDRSTWNSFTVGTTTVTLSNIGDKVYFKGTNNTFANSNYYNCFYANGNNCSISASGDITTILNETGNVLDLSSFGTNTFSNLFNWSAALKTAPILPSTTLSNNCYSKMFYQCTNLIYPTALPATTLTTSCYYYLFYGCTSLVESPALPATTLASSCYYGMFGGCSNLTKVPSIPATTLVSYCWWLMFNGCTSLYVSDTQTEEAPYEWNIPTTGTFTNSQSFVQNNVFSSCLGTRSSSGMTGAQGESHTYYTQNQPIS